MRMNAEAQAAAALASKRPPFNAMTPHEARAASAAGRPFVQPDAPAGVTARDFEMPGEGGPLRLRVYRPPSAKADASLPCLIYLHGGGWMMGDLDSHDVPCKLLCLRADCSVIAVDYRLAPEHKFPAPVDDTIAAWRWIIENAPRLGVDPSMIAVGGDSAGANLATVLCLTCRDNNMPSPMFQLLIYPATDLANRTSSYERCIDGVPLTAAAMEWFRDHYLGDEKDRHDWRASPLLARRLAGLPPAMVVTAGYDPLCDEGAAYARRLVDEGVETTYLHLSGQIHGFFTMGRMIRDAEIVNDASAAALRNAFAAQRAQSASNAA